MKKKLTIILTVLLLVLIFTVNAMSADPTPSLTHKPKNLNSSLTRKPKDALKLPKYLPENNGQQGSKKNFTLPPVPENRTPQTQGKAMFELKGVVFEGNTLFSNEQLNKVAAPFLNRNAGMTELEELRYQITRYYYDKGYINSGALIKSGQKVTNGVVTYLIIEGKLTNIAITGNGSLRKNYIKKRIWPDAQIPFNTLKLQDYFQMLLQNPLIDLMDGNIIPGIKPGEASLEVDVKRARPYEFGITAGNHSSPSLGSEKLSINQTFRNLTGFGDSLNTIFDLAEGARELDATYSIPLNANNTTLSFNYNHSDNDIVSQPFDPLNIESKLDSSRVSLTHPIYHTLRRDVSIGLSLKHEETSTYMNNEPYNFNEGSVDGKSKATVVQLSQSFDDRTTDQVVTLRSTFSFGVDMFNPTIHSEPIPDGEFTAWLGQVQYGRRLGKKAGQVILKGNVQIADDRLLPMDQFSLGGGDSVRGYRKNEHTGDNGYLLSFEWRVPVWESQKTGEDDNTKLLQIAPFMDYGSAWEREYPERKGSQTDNILHSVGVGLLWSTANLDAQIYYGYAIEDVEPEDDYDIQDDGIHFSVTYNFF